MKQSLFELKHKAQWQHFAEQLQALENGQEPASSDDPFSRDYRRVCSHLALAEARGYSSHLIDPLHQLALRGHQQLYRHRHPLGGQILGFILAGFPRVVRSEWRLVSIAALLFFGSLITMGLLVYGFPELIYSVLEPQEVAQMQTMYDPDSSRIGQAVERAAEDDWMMFGYYILNNISIAFQTFATGLFFGLGSLFFLFYNGVTIGAVAGHLTGTGSGGTFWAFVIGHGAFELTAIALAGAAGLKLGWALVAPGARARGEALRLAASTSMQLIYGVLVFLLIAAFIEAYWSAMTWPQPAVKYATGAVLWALVIAYLLFAGRDRHAPD